MPNAAAPKVPCHVVMATVGSLGDLFPFLAIGQALRTRGHRVTVASHPVHRDAVEQAGLRFADASGMPTPEDPARFTARAFHRWRGPRFVVHDVAARDVRASYDRLAPVCADADVLLTSTLAFAGQILGEQLQAAGCLRWWSAVLAPAGFVSAFDPPATGLSALDRWVRAAPWRGRGLRALLERGSHGWTAPVRQFRLSLGLPPQSERGDPLHQGQHAGCGVLALFPAMLGAPQPDWPSQVRQVGFARYRQPHLLDPMLQAFLADGPPPLVFSLGSAAVHAGEAFLRESLATAVGLDRRAVLFTGSPRLRASLPATLPAGIHALDYAAHAALFPHATAVIHHGGIGTSAEALLAGCPMLVVPHGFDQPDNAARLRRLGVARVLPAARYRVDAAMRELRELLQPTRYAPRSARLAEELGEQHGAAIAAELLAGPG